jgi:shikimate dehydrogenase
MTARVWLLGQGIGYSASPAMLNAAFRHAALPIRYELHDVSPAALGAAVQAMRDGEVVGANVTTPHKVAVLQLVDEVDPSAARIGAANTIVRHDGRLVAHSTDLPAIAEELAALGADPDGGAVILGAGGASRAASAALTATGWHDVVTVTRERWADIPGLLDGADLLVNATPVGTGSGESPVPARLLRSTLPVLDLVYRPSPTRLVADARHTGAKARAGGGVLLAQAAMSFTLWIGHEAPISVMREALRHELGPEADV